MKRLISQKEALQLVGVCAVTFRKMQREGTLPQPVPGVRKYDVKAIEAALDRVSATNHVAEQAPRSYESTVESYERWKAEQGLA